MRRERNEVVHQIAGVMGISAMWREGLNRNAKLESTIRPDTLSDITSPTIFSHEFHESSRILSIMDGGFWLLECSFQPQIYS
jgi:cobyrinic acid a,c-diamide synthase